MLDHNNKYTLMQKNEYERDAHIMNVGNHSIHNDNPDYWNILLADVVNDCDRWENKRALDFGCGCGRNIHNLLNLASWDRVDGVDISANNIHYSDEYLTKEHDRIYFKLYINNGIDLREIKSNEYDFIMSTIVFQHICVYEIRFSLLLELYRVLNNGGRLSIQFPFGPGHPNCASYYENYYDALGTNSQYDVRVDSIDQIEEDLHQIGFTDIEFEISNSWSDAHNQWVYVKANKDEA